MKPVRLRKERKREEGLAAGSPWFQALSEVPRDSLHDTRKIPRAPTKTQHSHTNKY